MATKVPRTITALQRWAFNMTGYNKYGLLHDDCLKDTDDVEEAVRRIPQHLRDARNYRMIRAFHVSLTHNVLPKEQWTKIEEDHRYLQPYLEEVVREREEKEEWERNH